MTALALALAEWAHDLRPESADLELANEVQSVVDEELADIIFQRANQSPPVHRS